MGLWALSGDKAASLWQVGSKAAEQRNQRAAGAARTEGGAEESGEAVLFECFCFAAVSSC